MKVDYGHAFLLSEPLNFILFCALIIIVLAGAGIMSLTWGLTTVIAIVFLAMGFIIILLGRGGNSTPGIFLICIGISVLFFFLAFFGVDFGTVDLSFIPGVKQANYYLGW